MNNSSAYSTTGWLAFEINVLRRSKFQSIALPFGGETNLGIYLKRLNARIFANGFLQADYIRAVADIQNNNETLSDEDLNSILEDAYVPRYERQNQALVEWFGETDSWWFENVRQNIEKIESPVKKAIALKIALETGDYFLSFCFETRKLRQPLSTVYRRLHSIHAAPFDNSQNNVCQTKSPVDFIAESYADLMFLRLPETRSQKLSDALGWSAWREEWLRSADDFWKKLDAAQAGKLGGQTHSRTQYLNQLEDFLTTAAHIDKWAIACRENGFVSAADITETIARVRRVETVYTKDFSELTGTKAVIVIA